MELGPLLTELEELGARIDREGVVPGDRLSIALAGATEIAPALEDAQLRQLAAAVEALCQAARDNLEGAGARLRELRVGKRALRGYGNLRSHKSGQKIRTKA